MKRNNQLQNIIPIHNKFIASPHKIGMTSIVNMYFHFRLLLVWVYSKQRFTISTMIYIDFGNNIVTQRLIISKTVEVIMI